MTTLDFTSGVVPSSSSVALLAAFLRFRPPVGITFAAIFSAGFFASPLTEALAVFLDCFTGVDFSLIELLVERGAAAIAREVLLGLDDDAVGSATFFCLFVVAVIVASAAELALRFAGAMISTALNNYCEQNVGRQNYLRSDSQM